MGLAHDVALMPTVVIESPYAGDVEANVEYARSALAHSLSLGEAPFASHLLYTQPGVLRDDNPEERLRGIQAGFAWGGLAKRIAFYCDRGLSNGMRAALDHWSGEKVPWTREFEIRFLSDPKSNVLPELHALFVGRHLLRVGVRTPLMRNLIQW